MKKLFVLAFSLLTLTVSAQISDTATLRNYINANIVPNSTRAITATMLNNILNGNINVLGKYKVDSIWANSAGDTISYKVGAVIRKVPLVGSDLSVFVKYSDTTSMLEPYLRSVYAELLYKPLTWLPEWTEIQNAPTTFTPSAHTHPVNQVTGLQDSLSDRYTKDQSDARYLQGNQTITLSGDVMGSGTTAITTTLKNTGTAGTYTKVTTDPQGRVTSGTQLAAGDIPNLSSTYIPVTQKGAANGVASLGSDGKVPSAQLPTTGSLYQGTWNASTNTPTIVDGVGTAGWYYRVSTGGTQDLGSGDITFNAGDDVIYNGTIWQRVPAASAVSSVNGMTGDVVIDKDDVGLGNVDNTSDLAKPISTATQTALNSKESTIAPGTTAQVWIGNKTWATTSTLVRPLFSAGTGLTYNSTTGAFAANFGTTAGTIMQGNDSRVTGAVPNTRTITAGTGLTGGGDLSANRSFAIDPAYSSFTNYYTKTNLQTSGQAAVHWGNLTNVPGSFPTTSNLQTVLGNGNTATNSIVLGSAGNTNSYTFSTIRSLSSVNYTATYGIYAGAPGASMISSDGTNTRVLRMPTSTAFPQYSPDNGSTFYEMWHSNNHPAGSAFTPTLTGANVLSSLTVNSAGHVSALTTRVLTAGDISAILSSAPANVSWDSFLTGTTSAFVANSGGGPSDGLTVFGVNMPSNAPGGYGAQIGFRNNAGYFRTLEAGTYGSWLQFADRAWVTSNFAAGSGSGSYIQNNVTSTPQVASYRINGAATLQKDGSNALLPTLMIHNAAATRGVNIQLNADANPGLATWIHNGSAWVKRQEYFADGNATFYGSTLNLSNSTSNLIYLNSVGIGAPTFTTRSTGTKIALWPTVNATNVDYGIGVEASHIWLSTPQNATTYGFKWYGGTTEVARLSGTGQLSVNTSVTSPLLTSPSGNDLNLSAPAGHFINFNPGGSNKGAWDDAGRLGIGTTPTSLRASLLEVAGNVWSTDAYLLGTGSVPVAEFFLSGSDAGLRTMSTQNFVFNTNADTERMRIDGTSGNILVNTTSDNGVNKLQVNGSISSTGQLVNGWLTVTGDASLGNENVAINTLGQITTNGTIEAGGSITTSTDLNAVGAVNAGGKVSGQHFKGGATPSVTKGALVTGSASVSGNDVAGTVTVTVTTGTSLSTNSEFFTLNFGVAYTSTPRVVFSPASATTATLQCYVKNAGTGSFQIATAPSLSTVVTTYVWNYHVIE